VTNSLQFRLAWRLALVFAAVILATSLALFFHRDSGRELSSDALGKAISRIARSLSLGPDGQPAMSLEDDDNEFEFAVLAADGRRLFASPDAPTAADLAGLAAGYVRRLGPGHERIATFARVETAIGPVEIQVEMGTQPQGGFSRIIREVAGESLPILLPTLLGALLIGAWTLNDGLKPLKTLARAAARITPAESQRRLPVDGLPTELAPLVRAINAALDRLEGGFRAQRDFTADAAHQLRTPLAILGAHLDTLGDRATASALREDVARMSRLVEQLLQVSELEALTLKPEERADLSALAREVAEALAPLAISRRRDIAVLGADAPLIVHGNHDSLHQALRNLVENALSHTAEKTAVEISVQSSPPALVVRDHGPGVPAADRENIFRRFWRADRRGTKGAGLGLAIVQRIAAAHGARVFVEAPADGGARFVLAFAGGAPLPG
jgi:signal transduction histidine kinase